MKMPSAIRAIVLALAALTGVTLSSAAHADEGFVQLTIYKAGWVIGGSGGSGVLNFRGRRYPLSTGGLVIASEAKQSMPPLRRYGLLRRLCSLAQTHRVCRRQ
jgi:hypothetical protein